MEKILGKKYSTHKKHGACHMQAPNPKHQISNKFQLANVETKSVRSFEIGIWSLFGICLPAGRQGICDLEF
jgi:hypothetical protein